MALPGTLLILTALRYEAGAIAKRLRLSASGPAGANEVAVRVVGPRCGAIQALGPVENCRGIVMAGLAGALDPSLAIGDLVVDRRSDLDVGPGRWSRGEIHTSADLAASVAQKRALFEETGALVVDMENSIARQFAAGRGIPFLGIRAVSDRAGEPLDPATLRWVDPAGGLRVARLAADLCARPRRIPALYRLGRRSGLAAGRLAEAVHQIVSARESVTSRDPAPCRSTA